MKNAVLELPKDLFLSPILFLVITCDIELYLEAHQKTDISTQYNGFADDLCIVTECKDIEILMKRTEDIAGLLERYFSSNGLAIDPENTKFLIIRPTKTKFPKNESRQIQILDKEVKESERMQILELHISRILTWNHYIEAILLHKLRKCMFTLRRLKGKVTTNDLMKATNAIFLSRLLYAITVFGTARLTSSDPVHHNEKQLQTAYNRTLRLISPNFLPMLSWGTKNLCQQFGVLSINQQIVL